MSELARRRRARDLWISRGHVGAAVAASLLLAAIAFSAGTLVGRSGPTEVASTTRGFGDVPDDSLVTLLARVEATAHPGGGVEDLTFPDALYRDGGPEVVLPDPVQPHEASAVAGAEVTPVVYGVAPGFAVEVQRVVSDADAVAAVAALRQAGFEVWAVTERVGDETSYRIGVGHHATQAEAAAWLTEHTAELPEGVEVVKLP